MNKAEELITRWIHVDYELDEGVLLEESINYLNRKDKLIVGSEWVCDVGNKVQEVGNYQPHVVNLEKGLVVEIFDVNGLVMFGHNPTMETWQIREEQFLACFNPKEEENERNKV